MLEAFIARERRLHLIRTSGTKLLLRERKNDDVAQETFHPDDGSMPGAGDDHAIAIMHLQS